MQFVAEYKIAPGSEASLQKHVADHLAFRMALKPLRLAMQIHSDKGAMIGSIVILDADDHGEAEALAAKDPFIAAGVYDLVAVRPCQVRYCDLIAGPP